VELVRLPPVVVTMIFPVVAPVGTVTVICVSEFTVNVAEISLNATFVVCRKPVPVILTEVPTGPLDGVKVFNVGVILYVAFVATVVDPVVTVTGPVNAPA